MTRWLSAAVLLTGLALVAGCYYKPEHKRAKAHPSFLSEADAEGLISRRLARYGIKFITNMKLKRDGVEFVADGYDRDLRVGFEYRSHEGRDFEGEDEGTSDGLSAAEIEALRSRQDVFREYFLIVEEGTAQQVEQAVEQFAKNLYVWEVLKKKKVQKADALFPDQDKGKKRSDLLPWEATGDLKTKREEMERREAARKAEGEVDQDDAVWQDETDGTAEDKPKTPSGEDPFAEEDPPVEKKPKPSPKAKSPGDSGDDVWGDEDEDF